MSVIVRKGPSLPPEVLLLEEPGGREGRDLAHGRVDRSLQVARSTEGHLLASMLFEAADASTEVRGLVSAPLWSRMRLGTPPRAYACTRDRTQPGTRARAQSWGTKGQRVISRCIVVGKLGLGPDNCGSRVQVRVMHSIRYTVSPGGDRLGGEAPGLGSAQAGSEAKGLGRAQRARAGTARLHAHGRAGHGRRRGRGESGPL